MISYHKEILVALPIDRHDELPPQSTCASYPLELEQDPQSVVTVLR